MPADVWCVKVVYHIYTFVSDTIYKCCEIATKIFWIPEPGSANII